MNDMPRPLTAETGIDDGGTMSDPDLDLVVRTIVANRFCCPMEEIRPETRLLDLGMQSLDMIEINIALEERLDLALPEAALPAELHLETVRDLTTFVAERVSRRETASGGGP